MSKRLFQSFSLGLIFFVGQGFGESIIGFIIIILRGSSQVNLEGIFLFGFIRALLTMIPYLVGFIVFDILTKGKIKPSYTSFGLNLMCLLYIYFTGLIQKEPFSFITGSLVTGLILLLIDQKLEIRDFFKSENLQK